MIRPSRVGWRQYIFRFAAGYRRTRLGIILQSLSLQPRPRDLCSGCYVAVLHFGKTVVVLS